MNLCIHTDGGDSSNVFNKIGFARILRTFGAVDSGYQCLLFDIFRHIINDMYFSEDAFGYIEQFIKVNITDCYVRYGELPDYIDVILCDFDDDFDIYKRTQFSNILADILECKTPQDVEIGAYEFCKKYYPDIVE